MTNTTLIVIVAVIAAVAIVAAWAYVDRRRRERLRIQFGPEYDRTLHDAGEVRRAESILERRQKRVSQYQIRGLTAEEQYRFGEAWRRVQSMFVDDPAAAVTEADTLVTDLMRTRGYPMADFERRAEDLSVDHPNVIQHYRDARAIADRQSRKEASTDDLR
jgi:hypothetical protein